MITLRGDTSLANITKRCNGISVLNRNVKIDYLLLCLMRMMETGDIVNLLLEDNELTSEELGKWISEQDSETVNKFFKIFLEQISEDPDQELLIGMFQQIAKKFDLGNLSERSLNGLLSLLLMRTNSLEDQTVFNELYLTMLEKVNLSEASGEYITQILELLSKRAMKEEDVPTVEAMFFVLSKKAREEWIRKLLAPYMKKKKVYQTPILPKNCVFFQEQADGSKIVVIDVEKQQIDVDYHRTHFEKVGHPHMWFEFTVQFGNITKCRVYAFRDPIVKPASTIYRYPFSNVFEDFHTCWPDLKDLKIDGIHQLSSLSYLFLRSPSNDHLFRGKNLRELYEKHQYRDFDDSLLDETELTVTKHFCLK